MPAFLVAIFGAIPSLLGKILPSVLTGSARAEELKAEKELIEAKAFAKGRISPKYCFQFLGCVIAAILAFVFVLSLFFPNIVELPSLRTGLKDIILFGKEIFEGME